MNPLGQIAVYGYVRSGNRWLARLLTYYGDHPVNAAKFFKAHFWFTQAWVRYFGKDVWVRLGGHADRPEGGWGNEHIVHIFRDPRDIFVSWYQFLTRNPNPLWTEEDQTWKGFLGWLVEQHAYPFRPYVEQWLALKASNPPNISWVTHEEMYENRSAGLLRLMGEMGYRQDESRAVRAAELAEHEPNRVSYLNPQQAARRGKPGEWRYFFDAEDIQFIDHHYGDLIEQLGYGQEPEWKGLQ